jgi:ubiquinone/menaquinone biosynthesis C-methylase UbiE
MRKYKNTLKHYTNKLTIKERDHNHIRELVDYLHPFLPEDDIVSIADVGSGPFVTIGHTYPNKQIDLTPCDILAQEYSDMLDNANISPIIKIEYQNMESLTYPTNKFDIVHSANALDHTSNPMKVLEEMIRICKVGGWVVIRSFTHVGERNNYRGLHEWNLDIEQGNLVLWNKTASFILNDFHPWEVKKVEKRLIQASLHIDNKG